VTRPNDQHGLKPLLPGQNPLIQSIGYQLTVPDPNPGTAGVVISAADWQFCYDVAKPQLQVVVRASLAQAPSPAGGPPAPPAPTTIVTLQAIASDDDLNAIISWLGTFKGAQMAAAQSKKSDSSGDGKKHS
jgi:hypothetical protein